VWGEEEASGPRDEPTDGTRRLGDWAEWAPSRVPVPRLFFLFSRLAAVAEKGRTVAAGRGRGGVCGCWLRWTAARLFFLGRGAPRRPERVELGEETSGPAFPRPKLLFTIAAAFRSGPAARLGVASRVLLSLFTHALICPRCAADFFPVEKWTASTFTADLVEFKFRYTHNPTLLF
jgi:hypothetical protein